MTEAPLTASTTSLFPTATESAEILLHRIPVLVSGLPGRKGEQVSMAPLVAAAISRDERFCLLSVGLSSEGHTNEEFKVGDKRIYLSPTIPYHSLIYHPGTIAVDFVTPGNGIYNAERFAAAKIPFVMGTSGGDRENLEEIVKNSEISAVIAPNTDPVIIGYQMDIDELAQNTPGIFEGAVVEITESHQASKEDVSGTAIAFLKQYGGYGARPDGKIVSVRKVEEQIALGVPTENLDAHAYHWIKVIGRDGLIIHEFSTKVHGRESYVAGTLMAIEFLDRQMRAGSRRQVFSMADVLRGGDTNGR